MTTKEYTTLSVRPKDKKKFKKLCIDHNMTQEELFGKLVMIARKFKPEIENDNQVNRNKPHGK